MNRHSHALVTVVFESEFELLRLQAHSAAVHLPAGEFDEIVVIDNSSRGLGRSRSRALISDYGAHGERVRVLRADDICPMPSTIGWMAQQVLKLEVARHLAADRYLVLDAKNHCIAPLERTYYEADDGRPRVYLHSYESHPLRPRLEGVLRYFGLEPQDHVSQFTITATPFVFDRDVVCAMMDSIEASSGSTFPQEFVDQEFTEFFLYSAWLLANGEQLDGFFDVDQVPCPQVWPATASLETVRLAIQQAEARGAPLWGVHRKALARLDAEALGELRRFWIERQLFDDDESAARFLRANRRAFHSGEWRRRMREAPHIARRLVGESSRSR